MARQILILDGHPDPDPHRFIHALAAAYAEGARQGNHEVLLIRIADLELPLLRTQTDWEHGDTPEAARRCQAAMEWATHVVILYPLWLGSMPALLKAVLEQTFRPGFAFSARTPGVWPVKLLHGKSARIVVTTGMPALVYRWYFRAHSLRSLQRNVLHFVGLRPVRATVIGNVAGLSRASRESRLQQIRELGRAAR